MQAIRTSWNGETLTADWSVAPPSLDTVSNLATAVFLSLFTDRRANDDDPLPDDSRDRRGWYGDANAGEDAMGSRLWLLAREKRLPATMQKAIDYTNEALAWMVRDGVAVRIEVTAEWRGLDGLAIVAAIHEADGRRNSFEFEYAWRELA